MKLKIINTIESMVLRSTYNIADAEGNHRYTYVVNMDQDGDIIDEEFYDENGDPIEVGADEQLDIYKAVDAQELTNS